MNKLTKSEILTQFFTHYNRTLTQIGGAPYVKLMAQMTDEEAQEIFEQATYGSQFMPTAEQVAEKIGKDPKYKAQKQWEKLLVAAQGCARLSNYQDFDAYLAGFDFDEVARKVIRQLGGAWKEYSALSGFDLKAKQEQFVLLYCDIYRREGNIWQPEYIPPTVREFTPEEMEFRPASKKTIAKLLPKCQNQGFTPKHLVDSIKYWQDHPDETHPEDLEREDRSVLEQMYLINHQEQEQEEGQEYEF